MAPPEVTNRKFVIQDFFSILLQYKLRWLIPTILIGCAAFAVAARLTDTWEVKQAVIVRNVATVSEGSPGEFRGTEPLRRTEDMIVQICRSRLVLISALDAVGPPEDLADERAEAWPDQTAFESLREAMTIEAPNGAEFGTTEVFYISLRDKSRERATALVTAIFDQLRDRMGELRALRAQSLVAEAEQAAALAQESLDATTQKLTALERSVGPDFVELRMLESSTHGNGDLVRSMIAIEQEISEIERANQVSDTLLEILDAASNDPRAVESAPAELLAQYPNLVALKDALTAAELRTAALQKNLLPTYPSMMAAAREEEAIRARILSEVENAILTLVADRKVRLARLPLLQKQQEEVAERVARLADVRAEYSNLVRMLAHGQQEVQATSRRLAEVRASQAMARNNSIISRLDSPDLGSESVGPSPKLVAVGGILGGLMLGVGLVFLTVVEQPSTEDSDSYGLPESLNEKTRREYDLRERQDTVTA